MSHIRLMLSAAFTGVTCMCAADPLTPSGTDDYAAISNAIAQAETGGTVELGAGTFNLSGTLTLEKAVTLKGAGKGETILSGASNTVGRGLYVNSDAAIVSDLTITGYSNTVNGAGVYLMKGTVRNVAVTWCRSYKGSPQGGGVYVEGGSLADSDILHNCAYHTGSGYSEGGGVRITGGVIEGCRIVGNVAKENPHNAGVYMSSTAIVRDCYIAENVNSSDSFASGGAAGVMMGGGILENSIVCSNGLGGVRISGGTMRNTLVFGHKHTSSVYAGVYNLGGTIENCTIAGNSTTKDASGLSGLKQESGTTVNTLVYGNGPDGSSAGSVDVTGGTFKTNLTDKAVAIGIDCYVTNPKFKNAAAGDYHLALGSPAIGKAVPLATVPKDLDGVTRNADGKGADIGCYEYVPSSGGDLACAVSVDGSGCKSGDAMVIKAFAEGGDGSYTYTFYLDDSEMAAQTGSASTYTWENASPGSHSVRVVVTDGSGQSDACEEPQLFFVNPLKTFVSPSGSNTSPYDTLAKAAHSVADAFNALYLSTSTTGEIYIAAGTYPVSSPMALTMPIRLIGEDAATTTLDCSSLSSARAVTASSDGVWIEKLTIKNSKTTMSGGAIYLKGGTIVGCCFDSCQTKGSSTTGGAVYFAGGLITNCVFRSCSNPTSYGYSYGAAVYLEKGTLIGCRFEKNTAGSTSHDSGVYAAAGTVANCVFTGNGQTSLRNAGATVYNCLFYGNKCSSKSGFSLPWLAGVYQDGGSIWNCTIACNTNTSSAIGCAGLRVKSGTVKNTIVYDCPSADGTAASYSLASGVNASNNILDSSPLFVNPLAADFHVKSGSAAIDTGSDDTPATVDLDGIARPQQERTDIGCYEYVSSVKVLTAKIVVAESRFGAGDTASFSASVEGPNLRGLSYAWFLDGQSFASGADKKEISIENVTVGRHTLKVTVTNEAGESSTDEVADAFSVYPTTVYVSLTGSNSFPYDSWQTAATDISTAFSELWQKEGTVATMNVAEGTYPVSGQMIVTTPFRLKGAGRDKTILKAKSSGYRCLALQNADIDVSDITVSGFTSTAVVGGGVYIEKGVFHDACVTNCNCGMYDGSEGGGIRMSGGTVRDCEIVACRIVQQHGYAHGDGVYISSGTLENCRISRCWNENFGYGHGVEATGGTISNCILEKGYSSGCYSDAELSVLGAALVENCMIVSDTSGAIRMTAGTVRNCLVVSNGLSDATHAMVVVGGGTLLNATIADNGKAGGVPAISQSAGTVVNCIVSGNAVPGATVTGGTFATNLVDAAVSYAAQVGTIVTTVSPFLSAAHGNYRPRLSSSAVDRGNDGVWGGTLESSLDLRGSPRLKGASIDIGCFENQQKGFQLLVR